jgi:hypothetical protein
MNWSRNSPLLWQPNVRYNFHKSPVLYPTLIQINRIYAWSPILLLSSNVVFSFQVFRLKFCIYYSISPMRATCPFRLLDLFKYMSRRVGNFVYFHPAVNSPVPYRLYVYPHVPSSFHSHTKPVNGCSESLNSDWYLDDTATDIALTLTL